MLREIFAKKIGMTQVFSSEGYLVPVTVLEVFPTLLLEKVTPSGRMRVAYGKVSSEKKIKKPILGFLKKKGAGLYRYIKELEVEKEAEERKEVGVEIFKENELVDVRGKVKGAGFAGGLKRHNWRGQPASHGSTTHRRIGSAGSTTFPGRILKGLNMPGHKGDVYQTIKNLKIVKIDKKRQLLFLKGQVMGSRGTVVKIKKVK